MMLIQSILKLLEELGTNLRIKGDSMRRRLFAFFMLILLFGVSITGFVSYDYMKNWIMDSTRESLKSENALIEEYARLNNGNIDYDKLAKEIKNVINRRVTIIDLKGVVIGESDLSKEKLQNHLYRPEIQEALKSGEGTALRLSDTEKIPFYYFAKKTTINGKTILIRIAIKLTAINDMQQKYLSIILLAIFIGILISAILVIIYLNYFIRPINILTKMATTMSMGNYDKKIHLSSKDEIGQLGVAFNMLSERLELTINDLADKQNKLISILTSMDDGVIVLDKNEKIILINTAAKRLFNIDYDATGKYFIETIRNYDFDDIIKNMPLEDVEISIKSPSVKHFRIRTTQVLNEDGKNEQELMLMVIQDITKIKALEQMRTDFVANVSHELKTPLTSIKGFSETLKIVEEKETKDRFLDIINIEAERLTRLINDILTLSEIESTDFSLNNHRISINRLVEEVVHIMESVAKSKNIALKLIMEKEAPEINIYGDEDKFKQMIINLVDNGIKYTNNDGEVSVELKTANNEAIIKIKDNGIGIKEEHLSRLFERFYRVDKARSRSQGGTGLGLAIVKHIIILFNGRIDIKSQPGIGTEFTLYLPLS